jgi:hypothetical protein
MAEMIQVEHEIMRALGQHFLWEEVRLTQNRHTLEQYQIWAKNQKISHKVAGEPNRTARKVAQAVPGVLTPECEALLARLAAEGWQLSTTETRRTGDVREQEIGQMTVYKLEKP